MLITNALRLARPGAYPPDRFLWMHRAYLAVAAVKPPLTGHQEQIVGSLPTGDTLHLGAVSGTIEMIERAP